jgi:hypothetical protein
MRVSDRIRQNIREKFRVLYVHGIAVKLTLVRLPIGFAYQIDKV